MFNLLKRTIPVYLTIIGCIFFALATYYILKVHPLAGEQISNENVYTSSIASQTPYIKRLEGFNYIAPLMFVDWQNKSPHYTPLMTKVAAYIQTQKQSKQIIDASFYFRDIENTQWTGYQEDEKYLPGSLMKVPILITYLHMEETHPGTLNQKLYYAAPSDATRHSHFITRKLPPNKTYTLKELLHYSISYSDNEATDLLDQKTLPSELNKTHAAFGLAPLMAGQPYPINPKDYSLFLLGIFNASYLTIPHSEYAAQLLAEAQFNEGFAAGLPKQIKMLHKFGEAGTGQEGALSESAIIYVNNKAYLLTVMTKGTDINNLAATLAGVASIVYQEVAAS